jgi:hypothetical protein
MTRGNTELLDRWWEYLRFFDIPLKHRSFRSQPKSISLSLSPSLCCSQPKKKKHFSNDGENSESLSVWITGLIRQPNKLSEHERSFLSISWETIGRKWDCSWPSSRLDWRIPSGSWYRNICCFLLSGQYRIWIADKVVMLEVDDLCFHGEYHQQRNVGNVHRMLNHERKKAFSVIFFFFSVSFHPSNNWTFSKCECFFLQKLWINVNSEDTSDGHRCSLMGVEFSLLQIFTTHSIVSRTIKPLLYHIFDSFGRIVEWGDSWITSEDLLYPKFVFREINWWIDERTSGIDISVIQSWSFWAFQSLWRNRKRLRRIGVWRKEDEINKKKIQK